MTESEEQENDYKPSEFRISRVVWAVVIGCILLLSWFGPKLFNWTPLVNVFLLFLVTGPFTTLIAVIILIIASSKAARTRNGNLWHDFLQDCFYCSADIGVFFILFCFIFLFSRLTPDNLFYEYWWMNWKVWSLNVVLLLAMISLIVKIIWMQNTTVRISAGFLLLFIVPFLAQSVESTIRYIYPKPSIIETHTSPDKRYELVRYQFPQKSVFGLRKQGETKAWLIDHRCLFVNSWFVQWKNSRVYVLSLDGHPVVRNVEDSNPICDS